MKASLEESENAMKILASDYDGTLNYNGFDSQKLDAIARWRAAGNLFGLVSGRSADSLWELAEGQHIEGASTRDIVECIQRENGLGPEALQPGQRIIVPVAG